MTPKPHKADSAQAKRFIKAAREAGVSEDEAEVRANMKRIATAKITKTDAPKT